MRGAVHRGELEAIARLAHRLVGAAGALELDALEAAARDLERVASAGDASASRASIEQLASLVGKGGIT